MTSTYWLPAFATFSLGMAAVCLLELLWRRRSGGKKRWPYALLTGGFICLAWLLWANGRAIPSTPITTTTHIPSSANTIPPMRAVLPAQLPPPPPLITSHFTLYPPNEVPSSTVHRLPLADAASADYRSPTRLQIPTLHINQPIVPVPIQNGTWAVDQLGGAVGLLAGGGQYPGADLAMVFAGHMTLADGRLLAEGAFANLQYATYGTEIMVELGEETAVYQVSEISRITPTDVDRLYLADGDSILLLTCTDWDEHSRLYTNRLLIRATRTEIQ